MQLGDAHLAKWLSLNTKQTRASSTSVAGLPGVARRILTTTTLSEQNYTLSRTTLSGAELHFEQNYTLSRTTPKIQISKM
jgi:hypothetical protein